jgi:ABC-2 type transport system permease protein
VSESSSLAPALGARVVDGPLEAPSSHGGLIDVFRRHYLLRLLVRRELSARYQGSALGLLWSYVNPLSQFLIYYVVVGVLLQLHKDVPNFAIHMFCGIIVVHFFNETFNAGTRSIVRNKSLVSKMALPREMFPVASMLVSAYHVAPQLVILLIACVGYGWTPDPVGLLALLLGLAIIMILGTGLALLFAAANVFFRDFSNVVHILTNFVRFGVPMIYPYSIVHERFGAAAQFYLYNPIADAVLLLQRCFWVGSTPHPAYTMHKHIPGSLFEFGFLALGISIVVLAIGQWVFSTLNKKIPERLNA